MKTKLFDKYNSAGKLEALQSKIITRGDFVFGNKASINRLKVLTAIDDILLNSENFLTCDICDKSYSPASIKENFDGTLSVCDECIENYYIYCSDCGTPLYTESQELYTLDAEVYCKDCYFTAKENLIAGYDITDKKLRAIERYLRAKGLQVNYENLKNIDFKIAGYSFSIESYSVSFRLGSWGGNTWIDLTSKESDLLRAIQWAIDSSGHVIQKLEI